MCRFVLSSLTSTERYGVVTVIPFLGREGTEGGYKGEVTTKGKDLGCRSTGNGDNMGDGPCTCEER